LNQGGGRARYPDRACLRATRLMPEARPRRANPSPRPRIFWGPLSRPRPRRRSRRHASGRGCAISNGGRKSRGHASRAQEEDRGGQGRALQEVTSPARSEGGNPSRPQASYSAASSTRMGSQSKEVTPASRKTRRTLGITGIHGYGNRLSRRSTITCPHATIARGGVLRPFCSTPDWRTAPSARVPDGM
jgi:hypothetical protein